jgi:hypothetical protein
MLFLNAVYGENFQIFDQTIKISMILKQIQQYRG